MDPDSEHDQDTEVSSLYMVVCSTDQFCQSLPVCSKKVGLQIVTMKAKFSIYKCTSTFVQSTLDSTRPSTPPAVLPCLVAEPMLVCMPIVEAMILSAMSVWEATRLVVAEALSLFYPMSSSSFGFGAPQSTWRELWSVFFSCCLPAKVERGTES